MLLKYGDKLIKFNDSLIQAKIIWFILSGSGYSPSYHQWSNQVITTNTDADVNYIIRPVTLNGSASTITGGRLVEGTVSSGTTTNGSITTGTIAANCFYLHLYNNTLGYQEKNAWLCGNPNGSSASDYNLYYTDKTYDDVSLVYLKNSLSSSSTQRTALNSNYDFGFYGTEFGTPSAENTYTNGYSILYPIPIKNNTNVTLKYKNGSDSASLSTIVQKPVTKNATFNIAQKTDYVYLATINDQSWALDTDSTASASGSISPSTSITTISYIFKPMFYYGDEYITIPSDVIGTSSFQVQCLISGESSRRTLTVTGYTYDSTTGYYTVTADISGIYQGQSLSYQLYVGFKNFYHIEA